MNGCSASAGRAATGAAAEPVRQPGAGGPRIGIERDRQLLDDDLAEIDQAVPERLRRIVGRGIDHHLVFGRRQAAREITKPSFNAAATGSRVTTQL